MANNNDKFISRENAKTLWGYMIDLLTGKQNKLTFDETPTQSSDNPVKSGGIFTALAGKGTYSKPQNGIPKTDLENAVQTSLGLADSALQSETDPTVPSWAKASSKPSYTQDEVGDGTTYKRVTQTEKDSWSGKQNALSTTQMQAVNSGITSEGVAQISKNQSEIEWLEKNAGGKNLFDISLNNVAYVRGQQYSLDGLTGTVSVIGDGTLSWSRTGLMVTLPAGTYVFSCNVTTSAPNGRIRTNTNVNDAAPGVEIFDSIICNSTGTYTRQFTLNTVKTFYIFFYTNFTEATTSATVVAENCMICKKTDWDRSQTFQPHALPNAVITPALIKQIDDGSKNLWDFANAPFGQSNNETHTKTDNYITVTSSATGGWAYVSFGLPLKTGRYVFGVTISNLTKPSGSNPMIRIAGSKNGDYAKGSYDIGDQGKISFEFEVTQEGVYYVIFGSNWQGSPYAVSYTASDLIVCKPEDWNASQRYSPYRVPITGLMSVVDKEVACSTTLTTTGIKFTATEKAAYRITATAIYYNSIPWKLAIKYKISSSSNQGTLCTVTHVDGEDVSLTVSGIRLLDVGGEFEIFAQYANSTNNRFYVLVEKIG